MFVSLHLLTHSKPIMNMELSIIVPVYNVEKYIHACLESIYRQGLDEKCFEVIIVNDGTMDGSMRVIEDLLALHSNIIVISQENQGLSVARNNAMKIAQGKYILMPDSDDLIIDYSVKPLLDKALETGVDMIVADYLTMNDQEIEESRINIPVQNKLVVKETSGIKLLTPQLCRFYWRTLYRREFLTESGITFVPGIYSQDVPFTNECFLKAKRCLRTSWLLNIYRRGHDSVSNSFSVLKGKNRCVAIAKSWGLLNIPGLSEATRFRQIDIVFSEFLYLISSTAYGHLSSKTEMYQIIDYLREVAPDLCFTNGLRQKLYTFMYRNMPHIFICSYFVLEMIRKNLRKWNSSS